MTRLELLALMAAIVHAGGDALGGEMPDYSPEQAVERADAILRAAEHKYPADRPEESTQICRADSGGNCDWYCSLPKGHIGDHAAFENHDLNGELLKKWPVEEVLAKGAAV